MKFPTISPQKQPAAHHLEIPVKDEELSTRKLLPVLTLSPAETV